MRKKREEAQSAKRLERALKPRQGADRLTERMNRVIAEVGSEVDEFIRRASRQVLERIEE